MRKFQKAALAGATAVAVAFGSTAVATAADENPGNSSENQSSSSNSNGNEESKEWKAPTKPTTGDKTKPATGSTKVGGKLGAHKDGQAIGTDYDAFFGGEGWTEQAPIYKLLFVGGIATFVSALVGLVFGPAYNFFVHGPSF
ncbi:MULTISPECIES: hypothetical protein [Corynebacterium]|uniref:hypothetical protein n=1 Tax=Corynebacterium TaxID=1716 RepID=UPI0008A4FC30|nr:MULTISPECIES: hypothetical protein [Corynebacterium]MDK7179322.1 hypothetical protein [Corynebacterium riegelii]OFT74119.1 hypothetical protein HMPREF3104_10745 [Corynebacterium sp. HMSC30G07]PLA13032.1 hypothetical protein CYJ48_06070 [Corynebacterium riegelii]